MTTLPNGSRALPSSYLFIRAGGPNAGEVWLRSPGSGEYKMRPASAEEIALAESEVSGFAETLAAARSISDGAD